MARQDLEPSKEINDRNGIENYLMFFFLELPFLNMSCIEWVLWPRLGLRLKEEVSACYIL